MYVNVEVDISDFLNDLSDGEYREVIREGLMNGYGPEGWHRNEECPLAWTTDPVARLTIITELRRQGYTVEPGGSDAHSD